MEVMAAQMKKFDLKGANKITGNIKVYNNVIAIWKFCSKHPLQNLDYETYPGSRITM
jgi:hypothetical protein